MWRRRCRAGAGRWPGVLPGEHEVEDDEVEVFAAARPFHLGRITHGADLETLFAEIAGEQIRRRLSSSTTKKTVLAFGHGGKDNAGEEAARS